ncbi:MAG: hypothetical protein ABL958_17955 [Bdellovibrionia bacterium]
MTISNADSSNMNHHQALREFPKVLMEFQSKVRATKEKFPELGAFPKAKVRTESQVVWELNEKVSKSLSKAGSSETKVPGSIRLQISAFDPDSPAQTEQTPPYPGADYSVEFSVTTNNPKLGAELKSAADKFVFPQLGYKK